MTADRWTHHDPAVRKLIREAQAEAWDAGATKASPYGGGYLRSLLIQNPHRDIDALGFLRAALAPAPTEDANGAQIGQNERLDAYDGAAADRRSMCDPESGRIDNWSER